MMKANVHVQLCLGNNNMEKLDPTAQGVQGNLELISAVDHHRSELDEFMVSLFVCVCVCIQILYIYVCVYSCKWREPQEAYCRTLKKVKEVIQEPQQESMEFINHMYSQLQDLLRDFPPHPSSSCKLQIQ